MEVSVEVREAVDIDGCVFMSVKVGGGGGLGGFSLGGVEVVVNGDGHMGCANAGSE